MPEVKRTVKLVTKQQVIDKPSPMEGFPMRKWSIEVYLLNDRGEECDESANIFDKVTYKLHPSFEKRATQVIKQYPFRISEEGWGEFDMAIVLTGMAKGGDHTVDHDLNFQTEKYEATHVITFRNPKPDLVEKLRLSGPAGDENGIRGKTTDSARKKSRKDKNVDMEKLAEGLQKLSEDDLLQVVQLIHDNKTQETYTKNDVENGEFHVDLYTLPDSLVKQLWDFTAARTEL